jgi:hypothetical protein
MSTTQVLSSSARALDAEDFEYRPFSTGAIASAVLGVLSLLIFAAGRDSFIGCLLLSPIPLLGLAVGWRALASMRANPNQYSGGWLARTGLALSAFSLIGGIAFSGYVYATEVPDGYVRTSFFELAPDEAEQRGDVLIPADIVALNGKKVFIKGYIRPDSTPYRKNIAEFLLVRDYYQCCFGDRSSVKYFDQIKVKMTGDKVVNYHNGVFRMGGTLQIQPENIGTTEPTFVLAADYAQ